MNERKTGYLDIRDLESYRKSYKLSNYVWEIIMKWDYFPRETVGRQFVRAVDSISANIAEGFGRYHKKDQIKFYRYSLGSLKESQDWCEKSKHRKLINSLQHKHIQDQLCVLPREIYNLINFTDKKLTK